MFGSYQVSPFFCFCTRSLTTIVLSFFLFYRARRSEDGRGPLWWAYEFQRSGVIDLLMKYKIRTDLTDADGRLPNE